MTAAPSFAKSCDGKTDASSGARDKCAFPLELQIHFLFWMKGAPGRFKNKYAALGHLTNQSRQLRSRVIRGMLPLAVDVPITGT